MRKRWTDEETNLLRKLYEEDGLGWHEAAGVLGRSVVGVHVHCKRNGFHHTEEQQRSLRSRIHSGENNGMWGKTGPNLGLTKENSERISKAAKTNSVTKLRLYASGELKGSGGSKNGMWGRAGWRRGQTKSNNEMVRQAASKCSVTKKLLWKGLPEDEKERRRILWASQARKCKKKRTSIELIVDSWLKEFGVEFQAQVQMGRWIPDFYIPSLSVVVECDGDYWHCNPIRYDCCLANNVQKKNMDRDKRKEAFLNNMGIRMVRLWEMDIRSGSAKNILMEKFGNGV